MTANKACVIPARGGSKRIPRKNIRIFHGKPLIAWSIESALSSNIFESVYVSTDDEEVAAIARSYGAKVPFKRPRHLSDDYTIDKDVRKHFIEWYNSSVAPLHQLCYLYPTAPFVTPALLIDCDRLLNSLRASVVQTVVEYDYPVMRALKVDKCGRIVFKWPEFENTRSQDIEPCYHDAGQCYFYNLEESATGGPRIGRRVSALDAKDIDTIEDFEIAEVLFSRRVRTI